MWHGVYTIKHASPMPYHVVAESVPPVCGAVSIYSYRQNQSQTRTASHNVCVLLDGFPESMVTPSRCFLFLFTCISMLPCSRGFDSSLG